MIPHHEKWAFWYFYFPIYWDYFWNIIRLRTWKYPFLVNPKIELSGFIGEKKSEIFAMLPKEVLPETFFVGAGSELPEKFKTSLVGLWVAKPDQGERGFGVRLLRSHQELVSYHQQAPRDYLIQKFIEEPVEAGVFFVRTKDFPSGRVTSLVLKERAEIRGDGLSTLRELCQKNPRYQEQIERLSQLHPESIWDRVLARGEVFILDEIRNHRRGALFRDGRAWMGPGLEQRFQQLFPPGCGFNYGRVDLRARSLKDLSEGTGLSILEVNGVTSEPGEIYDPGMTLNEAYRILRRHWQFVAEIGEEALRQKVPTPSTWQIYSMFRTASRREDFRDR